MAGEPRAALRRAGLRNGALGPRVGPAAGLGRPPPSPGPQRRPRARARCLVRSGGRGSVSLRPCGLGTPGALQPGLTAPSVPGAGEAAAGSGDPGAPWAPP